MQKRKKNKKTSGAGGWWMGRGLLDAHAMPSLAAQTDDKAERGGGMS